LDETPNPIDNPYDPKYPAPPRVHWAVLLAFWSAIVILTEIFVPKDLWRPVTALAFAAWPLYLCVWLLRLNSKSKSLLWLVGSIAGQLFLYLDPPHHGSSALMTALEIAGGLASFALPIVVIYVIRTELQEHYNEREPIGLHLDPFATFAFSYFYFQYHLYEIAQAKRSHSSDLIHLQDHGSRP
jgi:hypothetical protein